MGRRENKVETYLRDEVRKLGGDTRKFVSPGHVGVPDQLVLFPWRGWPTTLVETKTLDGVTSSKQEREHSRLARLGVQVYVLSSRTRVDAWLQLMRQQFGRD